MFKLYICVMLVDDVPQAYSISGRGVLKVIIGDNSDSGARKPSKVVVVGNLTGHSDNQLTSIDISKCTKLTTLDITNNLLTAIDITKNQALQTLRIGLNKFAGELDLSTNPTIKSVYAQINELTAVKIGNNTASKPTFSFNENKLTSFDATGIEDAANAILFLIGNQLTEIKLPSTKMKTLNILKNNFTLATLPAPTVAKTFNYAPLNNYVIAESYKVGDVLDLSSQTSATLNTQFAVYKSDKTALTEGTDYTVADGKITFLTAQEAVYVTMSSALYSKFTGTSIYKTTVTKVEGSTGINAITAHGVKVSTAGSFFLETASVQIPMPRAD